MMVDLSISQLENERVALFIVPVYLHIDLNYINLPRQTAPSQKLKIMRIIQ